jgi:spore coat protein U-like protein
MGKRTVNDMSAIRSNVRRRLTPSYQRFWRVALGLAGGLFLMLPGQAAARCTNVSATAVAFGSYNPMSATPLDAAGSISYACTPNTPPLITLSRGSSSTFLPRRLGGAAGLSYNLYLDAARTVIWGDGTGGTSALNGPTTRPSATVPVYGRIPPMQDVAAGAYTDLIVVTLNF